MSNTVLSSKEIFKVTIYWGENREEKDVITFVVDDSSPLTYQHFINNLQALVPLLKGASFTVLWKGQMGIVVNVSTNEDFFEAIRIMSSNQCDMYKFTVLVQDWKSILKTSTLSLKGSKDQAQFKIYAYWSDGSKPEVRRFGVDQKNVTSFVYLVAKIKNILPALQLKPFSVTWKDVDGDDVTITTDEEMMTAITAMSSSGLIKLNLYVKDGEVKSGQHDEDIITSAIHVPKAQAQATSNTVHFGVVCDGCDESITGFRYKCTVCDDFDLCSKCEFAGLHREHCMVRLPEPLMTRNLIKEAIRGSRHFLKSVSTRHEEDYSSGKKAKPDKSSDKKHHRHGHCSDRPGGHHHRRHSSWLETVGSYLNEFANLAGDVGLDATADKNAAPQQPKESESNQTQKDQKPEAPKSDEKGATAQKPQCPFNFDIQQIQTLMNMYLQNAQAFANQTQASTSRSDASVNAFVDTNNASVNTNDEVEMGQGNRNNDDSSSNPDSNADDSACKADDWTVIKEKELMDAMASAPVEPAPTPGFIPIGNLPEEFQERVNITEGQSLYPPLNTATAVLDPKEDEANATATAEPKAAPKPEIPRPTPPAPRIRHPVPHIDAALESMLSMGFTNDDNWLIQLLEKKNGDIAAVLDLLTPVTTKPKK